MAISINVGNLTATATVPETISIESNMMGQGWGTGDNTLRIRYYFTADQVHLKSTSPPAYQQNNDLITSYPTVVYDGVIQLFTQLADKLAKTLKYYHFKANGNARNQEA